jgi:serine/threonine protein kinase
MLLAEPQAQEDVVNSFVEELLDAGDGVVLQAYCDKHPLFKDALVRKFHVIKTVHEAFNEEGLAGTEVGDHLILEEIGRGGMGVVYLALQRSLRRYVALKVLPFSLTLDSSSIKRFQTEAQLIARFNHPNIVPVFSTGEEKGVYYITTALIPGLSFTKILEALRRVPKDALTSATVREIVQTHPDALRFYIDATRTSDPNAITIARNPSFWNQPYVNFVLTLFAEIADALGYAHKNQVCHGDLKPSNIMLTRGGVPMIVDFGLAQDMRSLTSIQSQNFAGTVAYASPELIESNVVNPTSDIWALGVTMYEMLTLRQPFQADDVASTVEKILKIEPSLIRTGIKGFSKDAEAIIFKCLEKVPEKRYRTAELVGKDIDSFLSARPVIARPVGSLGRAIKWTKRNSLVFLLSSVLALSLVITFLVSYNYAIKKSIGEGLQYYDEGKYSEALKSYDRALNRLQWMPMRAKSKTDIFSKMADAWSGKGEYEKAIGLYGAALRLDPDFIPALSGSGDVYFERGSYEKTISLYSKALALSPLDRNSYYQRGRAYEEEGLYSLALKDFCSAIRIAPKDLDTLKEISSVLRKMGLKNDSSRAGYLEKEGFSKSEIAAILRLKSR